MTYKAKKYIHCKATFVKETGYFINKDFLKEVRAIKNENRKKVKQLRNKRLINVCVYDKVLWIEKRPPDNTA